MFSVQYSPSSAQKWTVNAWVAFIHDPCRHFFIFLFCTPRFMPAHTFEYVGILPPLGYKGNCMSMLRVGQSLSSEMDTTKG